MKNQHICTCVCHINKIIHYYNLFVICCSINVQKCFNDILLNFNCKFIVTYHLLHTVNHVYNLHIHIVLYIIKKKYVKLLLTLQTNNSFDTNHVIKKNNSLKIFHSHSKYLFLINKIRLNFLISFTGSGQTHKGRY